MERKENLARRGKSSGTSTIIDTKVPSAMGYSKDGAFDIELPISATIQRARVSN